MNIKYLHGHKPYRKVHGMTLVELLVTLVVLGFAITLISGALGQVSHMLRVSSEESSGFLERFNNYRALHDVLSNMVIDPQQEFPFRGSSNQIELTTLAAPTEERGIPRRVNVKILESNNNFRDLFIYYSGDSEENGVLITRFSSDIVFSYIDASGSDHVTWPPYGVGRYTALPKAIEIRNSSGRNEIQKRISYEGDLELKAFDFADFFGKGR